MEDEIQIRGGEFRMGALGMWMLFVAPLLFEVLFWVI